MVWVMKNTSALSARYDCIVQAHNKHGWSAPSTIQTYYHDTGEAFIWSKSIKISSPKKAHDKSTNALRGSFPLSLELREEGFLL